LLLLAQLPLLLLLLSLIRISCWQALWHKGSACCHA
jgi:hypothetical protein